MKPLLLAILVSLATTLNAQNPKTSLLFKKGARLEYKSYFPKPGSFSRKNLMEVTRLIYTVQDVRDSNNIKYSYITKKGINPNDEQLTYEKKYVITSDGKSISVPIDFYGIDTVFFSNVYPLVKKDKGISQSSVFDGACTYNFPTDFKQDKFQVTGNSVKLINKVRDYETTFSGPDGIHSGTPQTSARIIENTRELDMTVKKYDTKGEQSMDTEAGTYECNKIIITTELSLRRGIEFTTTHYYNAEVGLVKLEAQQSKSAISYMELVRVKK